MINSLHTGGAEKLVLDTLLAYNDFQITADLLLLSGKQYPFKEILDSQKVCNIYELGSGSPYNICNILKIRKYLKNYDLVHVHLFPSFYFVPLANILSGSKVKLIYTEHSTSNKRRKTPLLNYFDRKVYRAYARVVCITDEVHGIIQNYTRLNSDRLTVIENGVDISLIKNAKMVNRDLIAEGLKADDTLLLQVAGFREPKDQLTVIKSLVNLEDNVKLVFAGDGPRKTECMQVAKELGLENRVFFLGDRTDIPELLKSSDIVILSSRHEGLSLSSIEGMASGRPFIASAVPGLIDLVKGAGLLFPKGDESILAERIRALITDDAFYQEVVDKCQLRAENYDISKTIQGHLRLYSSAIGSLEI